MKPLLTTIVLALGLSAITPVLAQQSLPVRGDKAVESAKLAYAREIAEVKYDSLPLEEIVARLREDFPEINFILPEELGEVIVRLELRNVTLTEIMQAIQIAGRLEHLKFEQTGERLFTFRRDEDAAQRETPKPALRTFNLSGYLAGRDEVAMDKALKELHQLLEDSWTMLLGADSSLRGTAPIQLRVHPGTQMLISVGSPDQLRALEEIVYNLPGMSGIATDPATGAPVMVRPVRRTVTPEPSPAASR